mmetsp:Transcript_22795/g.36622  ORF Transcript_22795/g.36622 Transcript_22795/m.36622 type:complete len:264 (-) Transcript_22795:709-1500(-)
MRDLHQIALMLQALFICSNRRILLRQLLVKHTLLVQQVLFLVCKFLSFCVHFGLHASQLPFLLLKLACVVCQFLLFHLYARNLLRVLRGQLLQSRLFPHQRLFFFLQHRRSLLRLEQLFSRHGIRLLYLLHVRLATTHFHFTLHQMMRFLRVFTLRLFQVRFNLFQLVLCHSLLQSTIIQLLLSRRQQRGIRFHTSALLLYPRLFHIQRLFLLLDMIEFVLHFVLLLLQLNHCAIQFALNGANLLFGALNLVLFGAALGLVGE